MGVFTAAIPSFAAGAKLRGVDEQTLGLALSALTVAWTTWPPTLTNLTQGNGIITAKYRQLNKTVDYRFKMKLGSTSAVGSNPRISLPVAPHAEYAADEDRLGSALLLDFATNLYDGVLWLISGSTVEIGVFNASGATVNKISVTATVPFSWGAGDSLSCNGTYEAA
jgi:hypothetical protein